MCVLKSPIHHTENQTSISFCVRELFKSQETEKKRTKGKHEFSIMSDRMLQPHFTKKSSIVDSTSHTKQKITKDRSQRIQID